MNILNVCLYSCLSYPVRLAHAPYCIFICGLSSSTILFHIISQNGTIFGKKRVITQKCVFFFSLRLLVGDQIEAQFFYTIRLFQSSTCFEQTRAHHQEVNCINTASGIVTLCKWPSGMQVEQELLVTYQTLYRGGTGSKI